MRCARFSLLLGVVAFLGCGDGGSRSAKFTAGMPAQDAVARAGGEAPAKANVEAVPRKIIYTATINIVVETFDEGDQKLTQLIKEFNGAYVAGSEVRGAPGSRRTGTWTVRVPVAQFDDFLDGVARLGELQQRKLDSEDITDRFYDLKADIQNNSAEEDALRKLLDKSAGKLEDVITVRRELKDIRGKINQQQGQLQRWEKLSELATATITMQERKDYVPPSAPAFGTSIGRTFKGSVDAVIEFCQGVILCVVAIVPWLPILALIALPFWLLIRRWRGSTSIPEVSLVQTPSPPTTR